LDIGEEFFPILCAISFGMVLIIASTEYPGIWPNISANTPLSLLVLAIALLPLLILAGLIAQVLIVVTAGVSWTIILVSDLSATGNPIGYIRYRLALLAFERDETEFIRFQYLQQEKFWKALDGKSFEREVAQLFKKQGYRVELTPATGDGGADIILTKGKSRIVIQCKAYASKVSVAVARELYAAQFDFNATGAILVALSGVTKPTFEYCRDHSIEVMDLNQILLMHRNLST